MENICIGIDIGGTTVKMGIFNTSGKLVKKWAIGTSKENNSASVISDIASSVQEVLHEQSYTLNDCLGIGLGVPGPVLPSGYVEVCVNLGWKDRYPARELSQMLSGIPVGLGNDANIAALGEMWQGGAKGFGDVVLITLGTGVGGGVIIDGKIAEGRHGIAGEIGHMHVINDENEYCNCGCRGCLEQIASATGIVREAKRVLAADTMPSLLRKHKEHISAKDVLDCAKEGDAAALKVIKKVCRYLGIAMSHIAYTVDPDVFVIGGGVSKAGEFLLKMIENEYEKYVKLSKAKPRTVLATLGNDAGIYGGAKLVFNMASVQS
ncbi:hypothetical protein HMPREF9333_01170 [Johnsonella ignava ATCC 51276]|jgi:ROK family protein (putative glucokinase)|uniref:Glucokinase n=1 Tax=Johnsonella ignava ATCC 51276 TaxID=679200 RepID=G5GHY0_9FIRM|nr:ROK family glucokinase [Johnsonella ignava]EHI55455.1 hypothetical protein HMPREF9333_01170 [Johnsonella ignava ATCC 51276]